MMTPADGIAARSIQGWTQRELAEASSSQTCTMRNFEDGRIAPVEANAEALGSAVEADRIRFVLTIGRGGAGVRLRRPPEAD